MPPQAGARTSHIRIDWPERTYGFNYPQTEADRKVPSEISVSLNGVTVGQVTLPDDPADARGVLSHYSGIDPGSYGFLTELTVNGKTLQQALQGQAQVLVRFTATGENIVPGGISLYGARAGSLPVEPTIVLVTQ